jgi:hypothetical protein
MIKAMIWKELRESGGILLLALVAFLFIATANMNIEFLPWSGENAFPLYGQDFFIGFGWIAAILAITLGLKQSLGEAIHGTYPFLFHRPVGRGWLLGMKLAVGLASSLICGAIPILILAWWAATPGTHASPFQWSMTLEACQMWAGMPLLYLAAFLSGIRPGRWLGTRLLPLVAAGMVLFWFIMSAFTLSTENTILARGVILLIVNCVVLASIFHVARQRDF